MKQFILCFLCLAFAQVSFAQLTLEHTYTTPATGSYDNVSFYGCSYSDGGSTVYRTYLFKSIYVESVGVKYVTMDPETKVVKFYNLDHSIYKTIAIDLSAHINLPNYQQFSVCKK